MSENHIETIVDQITKALSEHIDRNIPDDIMYKIQELTSLLASSSEALASAEMQYSQRLMEETEKLADSKLSATDKKNIIAGRLKKEAYTVTLTERLNKALVHAIEAQRSVLSYIKEEYRNASNNTH